MLRKIYKYVKYIINTHTHTHTHIHIYMWLTTICDKWVLKKTLKNVFDDIRDCINYDIIKSNIH